MMARQFDSGMGQYLNYTAGSIVGTPPFSLAAWVFPTLTSQNNYAVSITDGTSNQDYYAIRLRKASGGQAAEAEQRSSADGAARAASSASWVNNAWNHVAGTFDSLSSRNVYLDGGNKGSETTPISDPNPDSVGIGALERLTPSGHTTGSIAEAGIWGVSLDDADIVALASGLSPLLVRPDDLLAYWPLLGRFDPETPWFGPYEMSLINGPTTSEHPRIMHPHGFDRNPLLVSAEPPPPPPPPSQGEVPAQITVHGWI